MENHQPRTTTTNENPIGLNGIDFIEYSSSNPQALDILFKELGFSKIMRHSSKRIDLYRQNDITFLLNYEPNSYAAHFCQQHGPCASAMGWRVENADAALKVVAARGAEVHPEGDYQRNQKNMPAIKGIGESLIYLVDQYDSDDRYLEMGFMPLETPEVVESKGFLLIDHLTNNVYNGTMEKWANFYKGLFGFTEVRYFDIKGQKTGLQSYALKSPCGKFCIPINEASEAKSQINEYLDEYQGPGIQHIALLSQDLLGSLRKVENTSVQTLDISPSYYQTVFDRVPDVTEDKKEIERLQVLVDGDEEGYLLQIFTKNVIGPIFFEFIQRKNHWAFGEGNFQALFESIERDQMKRGYLEN